VTLPQAPNGWRKSSYSSETNSCVEVRSTQVGADVRDTKNRDGGHLAVPAAAWSAFLERATR
jgi:Domain of unknown function (DUF397)